MQTMKLMGTAVLALALGTTPLLAQITAVGDGEGEVDIVAWPGYMERGESDKTFDWITKFEASTSCKFNVKTANTSDEMVTLMNHANDLFAAHGLPRARSFCGGGWTSTLDTVKAAQEAGFTTEASAFNWSRIEEWKNVGTGELYRWLMAHWAPMNDRSQPYYPRDSDVLADAAPHLAILEVPHNGLTIDYVNSAELEYLFTSNWDGAPLAAPRTLQVGYHPAADFGHGYVVRLDGFLDLVDAHLAARDAGPVVYTTMSALVPAFPRP